MKNKTLFFPCLIVAGIFLLLSCQNRDEKRSGILKVYNWADYIAPDVLKEFPAWYKEQTGEDIKVIYQLFDINEIMLTKIARGKEDFDVVCPSDYIIERMLKNDLLLPINRDFGQTPDYIENVAPYSTAELKQLDYGGRKTEDYAVPYMWGTAGILYNKEFVPESDVESWSCLWDSKYKGKILMKDSYRDAYGTVMIYANRERLEQGEVTVSQLMNNYSTGAIDTVETFLKRMKPLLTGWEADFGKEMMTKSKIWLNMSWSGDAVWAIKEAQAIGTSLGYTVPREGSNIWYDGWVIPKYARNVKAASYFINYLCQPDVAIRNMEEIGYVSAIAGPEIMEYACDTTQAYADVSYFFGEAGRHLQVDPVVYPDLQVVKRCAMIRDAGEHTEMVLDMWSSVKGDNLNPSILIIIFSTICLLLFLGVYKKYKKYRRRQNIHHLHKPWK